MFRLNLKLLLVLLAFGQLQAQMLPRTILGLYVKNNNSIYDTNNIVEYAEMPLNHLGLKIITHDLQQGVPEFESIPDLRGILIWLDYEFTAPFIGEMCDKIVELANRGVKVVVFGVFPKQENSLNNEFNKVLNVVGLNYSGSWSKRNFNIEYEKNDPVLLDFERSIQGYIATYMILQPQDAELRPVLTAKNSDLKGSSSILASLHPKGGVVQSGFSVFNQTIGEDDKLYWMINPFLYFAEVFNTDLDPKPDTNTLAGRRIFYSHLDGDGWYNVSLIPKYYKDSKICAEVIYQEICLQYPDLPMTFGMIGAEVDFNWNAKQNGVEAGKKMYALPHVEVGTHTFTHPFVWQFFKDYTPQKEAPFLSLYPDGSFGETHVKSSLIDRFFSVIYPKKPKVAIFDEAHGGVQKNGLPEGYTIPRFYAKKPFDLDLEIGNALKIMEQVAPPGKKCMVYQWSGDAYPFEKAVQLTRLAGVPNLNGGNSRFDNFFLSYAWVAPIGRLVGKERQIYSSNSNENTYTNLWHDDFFGFQELKQTLVNTEMPIRVKPMNIYYHTYSGERLSSLNALHSNFNYVQKQIICPVATSLFAKIGMGFYTTEFEKISASSWKVKNRGHLQTIRFDRSVLKGVDFERSQGVIGQKHFHGSLYVYLDQEEQEPLIVLKEIEEFASEPYENVPYLIDSRWRVFNVKGLSFDATGFGKGEMTWSVPEDRRYRVYFQGGALEVESNNCRLHFELPRIATDISVHIQIQPL